MHIYVSILIWMSQARTDMFWLGIEPLFAGYSGPLLGAPVHVYTPLHMDLSGCRPNSPCKARGSFPSSCLCKFVCFRITSGSPLQRDLTRVISILIKRSQDWHVPARDLTRVSCVGSEHSRKEPSRQLIRWLFGTSTGPEAGTTAGPLQTIIFVVAA
jgi:hypothetical protein